MYINSGQKSYLLIWKWRAIKDFQAKDIGQCMLIHSFENYFLGAYDIMVPYQVTEYKNNKFVSRGGTMKG